MMGETERPAGRAMTMREIREALGHDVSAGALNPTEQPATLVDVLRGTADRIDAEDLPQTAEDVADFCDGARWATAQLRQIADEANAEPAGDATPDWLVDLARRYATALNSAERAVLRYALELAEDRMLSRGNEFAAVDFAALESLKQRAGSEDSVSVDQLNLVAVAADRAAVERIRAVLETEAVVGRSALEYRGLIASALMADEAQQPEPDTETRPGCTCSHPDTEHSIYGCADGCACEWMPKRRKRPPMDPVNILGIEAPSGPGPWPLLVTDRDAAQQQKSDYTESVDYQVVGDWGVDGAETAAGARAAVAKWLRAYPKCGAYAEQRIVRDWPDGSEFYGPWTPLTEG